jgi:hypothetical protein
MAYDNHMRPLYKPYLEKITATKGRSLDMSLYFVVPNLSPISNSPHYVTPLFEYIHHYHPYLLRLYLVILTPIPKNG